MWPGSNTVTNSVFDETFGHDKQGYPLAKAFIDELIERLPKLSEVDLRIIASDFYESRFGIYDHISGKNKKHPLASVAFHPSDNYTEASVLYDSLYEFADKGYLEIWGLSVSEFLSLPSYMTKMMRSIAESVSKKKAAPPLG